MTTTFFLPISSNPDTNPCCDVFELGSYKFNADFTLLETWVASVEDLGRYKHVIEIISPNKDIFTLTLDSASDKIKWMAAIKHQIEEQLSQSSSGYLGMPFTSRSCHLYRCLCVANEKHSCVRIDVQCLAEKRKMLEEEHDLIRIIEAKEEHLRNSQSEMERKHKKLSRRAKGLSVIPDEFDIETLLSLEQQRQLCQQGLLDVSDRHSSSSSSSSTSSVSDPACSPVVVEELSVPRQALPSTSPPSHSTLAALQPLSPAASSSTSSASVDANTFTVPATSPFEPLLHSQSPPAQEPLVQEPPALVPPSATKKLQRGEAAIQLPSVAPVSPPRSPIVPEGAKSRNELPSVVDERLNTRASNPNTPVKKTSTTSPPSSVPRSNYKSPPMMQPQPSFARPSLQDDERVPLTHAQTASDATDQCSCCSVQ
jgi:hypothetical protein